MLPLPHMKRSLLLLTSFILSSPLLAPIQALAQSGQQQAATEAASFVAKLNQIILFPLIALLLGVAFLVFIWGCAQYIIGATNPTSREQGMKHITFGIIGLVIMLSAWAILTIVTATFSLDDELNCANDPNGCVIFTVPTNPATGNPGGPSTGNPGGPTTGN